MPSKDLLHMDWNLFSPKWIYSKLPSGFPVGKVLYFPTIRNELSSHLLYGAISHDNCLSAVQTEDFISKSKLNHTG
jgi:hypothetical protein